MTPAPDAPAGRPDGALRAVRSGAATGAAVLVALAAHLAGGGTAPPAPVLAAVLALAWPVSLLLIGGRVGVPRLAAAIAVAQGMLHAVFALGVPAAMPLPTAGMGGMHDAVLLPAGAAMPHDAGMWWAHAAAWAVTVAAWARGEAVLRRLLRSTAVRRILALQDPVEPAAPPPARPVERPWAPAARTAAAHRDRGPPVAA